MSPFHVPVVYGCAWVLAVGTYGAVLADGCSTAHKPVTIGSATVPKEVMAGLRSSVCTDCLGEHLARRGGDGQTYADERTLEGKEAPMTDENTRQGNQDATNPPPHEEDERQQQQQRQAANAAQPTQPGVPQSQPAQTGGQLGDTVGGLTSGAGEAVGGLGQGLGKAVGGIGEGLGQTLGSVGGAVGGVLGGQPAPAAPQSGQAPPPQQGAPASPAAPDLPTQLQQLAHLRETGAITEEEFQTSKAKLLSGQ